MPARDGQAAVADLIKRLGLSSIFHRRLARCDSNRAYPASIIFNTLMRMLHDGRQVSGRCASTATGIGTDTDDPAIRVRKPAGEYGSRPALHIGQ